MYQSEDFFRNFAFSKKWLSPKRLKLPTRLLSCDKALVFYIVAFCSWGLCLETTLVVHRPKGLAVLKCRL